MKCVVTVQEVLKVWVPGGSGESSAHGWKEERESLLTRGLMLAKDFS